MTHAVDLSDGYSELLAAVKADVAATRLRAVRDGQQRNAGTVRSVGRLILSRQDRSGWGGNVVAQLSAY